jgi:hypothetical protein
MMDLASWEFTDLRYRMSALERRDELDAQDMLRAARAGPRIVVDSLAGAGLQHRSVGASCSRTCTTSSRCWSRRPTTRPTAGWSSAAFCPRSTCIRSSNARAACRPSTRRVARLGAASGFGPGPGHDADGAASGRGGATARDAWLRSQAGGGSEAALRGVGEETRLMTRAAPLARSGEHGEAVLSRLNRLVGRHLPAFADTRRAQAPLSPGLAAAIDQAQQGIQRRVDGTVARPGGQLSVTTPVLLEDLHQRKQALKQAAATPEERATIEIVALLFQSILTEERIPAACACGSRGCRCRCCGWRWANPTSLPPSTTRRGG